MISDDLALGLQSIAHANPRVKTSGQTAAGTLAGGDTVSGSESDSAGAGKSPSGQITGADGGGQTTTSTTENAGTKGGDFLLKMGLAVKQIHDDHDHAAAGKELTGKVPPQGAAKVTRGVHSASKEAVVAAGSEDDGDHNTGTKAGDFLLKMGLAAKGVSTPTTSSSSLPHVRAVDALVKTTRMQSLDDSDSDSDGSSGQTTAATPDMSDDATGGGQTDGQNYGQNDDSQAAAPDNTRLVSGGQNDDGQNYGQNDQGDVPVATATATGNYQQPQLDDDQWSKQPQVKDDQGADNSYQWPKQPQVKDDQGAGDYQWSKQPQLSANQGSDDYQWSKQPQVKDDQGAGDYQWSKQRPVNDNQGAGYQWSKQRQPSPRLSNGNQWSKSQTQWSKPRNAPWPRGTQTQTRAAVRLPPRGVVKTDLKMRKSRSQSLDDDEGAPPQDDSPSVNPAGGGEYIVCVCVCVFFVFFVYVKVYVVCVHVYVCVCIPDHGYHSMNHANVFCIRETHIYIHTYSATRNVHIHTYIHTYSDTLPKFIAYTKRIHTYKHTYIHIRIQVSIFLCTHRNEHVHTQTHTYIHTDLYTYIQTSTFLHKRTHTYIHTCRFRHSYWHRRHRGSKGMCVCIYIYIYYIHTYVYVFTFLLAQTTPRFQRYVRIYIYICIYIYIYTHVYLYMCVHIRVCRH